jgi:outer membrane biosynthesis protein TonB
MPLGLGPRFVVEAAFLIAVAVAAGMLSLATPAIVAVMAAAWLLVAAVEWGVSRRATRAGERERAATRFGAADRPDVRLPEPQLEPEPLPEPVPPAPVEETWQARPSVAPPDGPAPLPEPVSPGEEPLLKPEPAEERPELVAVPEPEPEPEPPPEPEPEPEPVRVPVGAEVVRLGAPQEPRQWNLWDLERAARGAAADDDAERSEERAFLLMYLREFAGPDGSLPASFDKLVRDAFGDLLGSGTR